MILDPTDYLHGGTTKPIDGIERNARHAGACEAMLRACRLLRARGYREQADFLLANIERIVEQEATCTTP